MRSRIASTCRDPSLGGRADLRVHDLRRVPDPSAPSATFGCRYAGGRQADRGCGCRISTDCRMLLVCSPSLMDAGPGLGTLVAEVALRPVDDSDLDALFEQMRDPESVRMAAFTAKDPDDRTAFDAHMAKVRTSPEATNRVIMLDGRLLGSIASFVIDGDTEVTYWIDRSFWGQGIASRALALLLESVHVRPLFARAASDNAGSLKVLQRAGFAITGTATSFANGRNTEIEETILRLDEPTKAAPFDASSGKKRTH
jgi:RimJ/RimL family protein N-acetyltransferase